MFKINRAEGQTGGLITSRKAIASLIMIAVYYGEITPEQAAQQLSQGLNNSWGAFQDTKEFAKEYLKEMKIERGVVTREEVDQEARIMKLIEQMDEVKGSEQEWPLPEIPKAMIQRAF
jgi:hypothetical protein